MNADRAWVTIIVALLATVLTGYILWEHRKAPDCEVLATFDGYNKTLGPMGYTITVDWPPKQLAHITITKIVRSNWGGFTRGGQMIALGEIPTTDQGQPLIIGHTYHFRFKQRIFNRRFQMKIRDPSTPANAN